MNLKYDNKNHTLRQVFYRYKFPTINKDFQSIDELALLGLHFIETAKRLKNDWRFKDNDEIKKEILDKIDIQWESLSEIFAQEQTTLFSHPNNNQFFRDSENGLVGCVAGSVYFLAIDRNGEILRSPKAEAEYSKKLLRNNRRQNKIEYVTNCVDDIIWQNDKYAGYRNE